MERYPVCLLAIRFRWIHLVTSWLCSVKLWSPLVRLSLGILMLKLLTLQLLLLMLWLSSMKNYLESMAQYLVGSRMVRFLWILSELSWLCSEEQWFLSLGSLRVISIKTRCRLLLLLVVLWLNWRMDFRRNMMELLPCSKIVRFLWIPSASNLFNSEERL